MRFVIPLAIVVCTHHPVDACVPAFERAIVGAPVFEPVAAVTITSEDVDVSCDEHFACEVVSTFGVAVAQPARVAVKGYHMTELTLAVDGRASATATISPADALAQPAVALDLAVTDTRLVLRARVDVVPFVDGCFTDGVIARHPYLGAARTSNERVLQVDTTAAPRVTAPASWDLVVDTRAATKYDRATKRLWFTVPGRRFTNGGPFVFIGTASGDGKAFRLRGGWEAAIGKPWLVLGVAGETDFAGGWNVAVTAEPTTRAWVLPLSLGAGGGVVIANDARVGGRAQLSVALGGARVMVSVDVLGRSDGGGADSSIAGLIGGSL